MSTTLTPYPEYKNTSLAWLNQVPSHWDLIRMKHLFTERVDKGHPDEPLLSATQSKGVVRQDKYENRTMVATKNFESLKLVKRGDFVISLRSFEGGIEKAHDRGIISSAYTVLKPGKKASRGFFKHFFKSKPFIDALSLYVTGIRDGQNINYSKLSRSNLPIPPLPEQHRIARFLDIYTARTDRLIRAKERLIELLEEQKQAIIQQAVTRGLDPDVEMKDPGVDWLGEVPMHWQLNKLKHVSDVNPKKSMSRFGKSSDEIATFLPMENVSEDGQVDTSIQKPISKLWDDYTYFESGDVIVAKITPCFENGKGAHLSNLGSPIGFGSTEFHVLRPNDETSNGNFLHYLLFSHVFREAGEAFMTGAAGQKRVSSRFVREFEFALPPLEEQEKIAQFLNRHVKEIETAIAREEELIGEIRAFCTSLISRVTTGKLDVREAEAAQVEDGIPVDLDDQQVSAPA